MLRFFVCVAIVGGALLTGCGQTIDATPDGGLDAGPPPTNVLEVEGDPRLTLVFGEEATIGVRYLDPDRIPIAGRLVSFVLEGRAHDSSLRAVDVVADTTGFATTTLMAGTTPAAFRVRITAEDADPAFVDVAVSDEGFGQLAVDVTHEGAREVDTLGVAVFAGLTCEDEETLTERGDRFRARTDEDEVVTFIGLPAGLSYAVIGRGEGPDGDLLAWGCVDGVTIEAESLSDAAVIAEDLPQQVRGSYAGTLGFVPTETAEQLGAEVAEARGELASDATLILDAVESSLTAAGDLDRAAMIAEARLLGGVDAVLEGLLTTSTLGPSVAMTELEAVLDARTERILVHGSLRLADETTFQVSHLSVGAPDDLMELDGEATGEIPTEVMGEVDSRGETLALTRLSIGLRASTLVRAIATASLDAPPETSPLEALLESFAGCAAMPEVIELAGACDASCLANACDDVMKSITMGLELRLEELDLARGRMDLRGDVMLTDETANLEVDRIEALLDGEWTGERSPEPESLDVDLEGTRIIPPG